jgi:hypothetical protein
MLTLVAFTSCEKKQREVQVAPQPGRPFVRGIVITEADSNEHSADGGIRKAISALARMFRPRLLLPSKLAIRKYHAQVEKAHLSFNRDVTRDLGDGLLGVILDVFASAELALDLDAIALLESGGKGSQAAEHNGAVPFGSRSPFTRFAILPGVLGRHRERYEGRIALVRSGNRWHQLRGLRRPRRSATWC